MASDNPRLFVSYSRDDSAFAEQLATDLRARGVNVWFDRLDIATGAPWDIEVEAGLRASQGALVILSPKSVASQNVMDEVSFALSEGKRILPVLYQPCAIPLRLARLQYVDFSRSYDDGLRRLVQDLSPARGAASSSTAPPPPRAAPGPTAPPRSEPAATSPPSATSGTSDPSPRAVSAGSPTWPIGKVVAGVALAVVCGIAMVVLAVANRDDATGTSDMDVTSAYQPTATDPASTDTSAPSVLPGTAHPDHPHVVADTSGQWVPENGYAWVDADSASGGGPVQWSPGKVHEANPHVVAASSEGDWTPAPGYTWVDVNSPDLLVVWKPGKAHSDHPNVVAAEKEGTWTPASGYDWVNPDDQSDLRVREAGSATS